MLVLCTQQKEDVITELSQLDEFGRILMSYTLNSCQILWVKIKGLVFLEENKFNIIDNGKVFQASITEASIKKNHTYRSP